MEFVDYPDRDLLMMGLADRLASALKSSLMTHERASFCVPGGTTPGPVFDVLSAVDLDWDRIAVFPTDERWVPETSPRSNMRLLRERLLSGKAAAATAVSLCAGADTPEAEAEAAGERLAPYLPISVLLLGMGADMHTASLFPGADRLAEALDSRAPPVLAIRAPGAEEPRLTLTAPVLDGAMHTHILITGQEKRAALEKARHLTPEAAPVRAVLGSATVHWAE